MRVVRRHADFERDFVAQLDWLVAEDDRGRIVQLRDGVDAVVRILSSFSAAGVRVAERGALQLRRLIFPKGPYVAWYVYDTTRADGEVWLVRLFHSRQKRPRPDKWLR